MDLNTIDSVIRPVARADLPPFQPGDAFLGGGTWLFSEPQIELHRLIDLPSFGWPPILIDEQGLRIAATCTLADLEGRTWPSAWTAAPLIPACCRSLLGSFKIWNTATVGGNICLALPAGPMTTLATALDGICVIWTATGAERRLPVTDFILGDRQTALAPGEILREIIIPEIALHRRTALHQVSLTPLGRSGALLVGTIDKCGFNLTITASTPRPLRLSFPTLPSSADLMARIEADVTTWHDDVHGAPAWRKNVTHHAAHKILEAIKAGEEGQGALPPGPPLKAEP